MPTTAPPDSAFMRLLLDWRESDCTSYRIEEYFLQVLGEMEFYAKNYNVLGRFLDELLGNLIAMEEGLNDVINRANDLRGQLIIFRSEREGHGAECEPTCSLKVLIDDYAQRERYSRIMCEDIYRYKRDVMEVLLAMEEDEENVKEEKLRLELEGMK